MHRVFVVKTGYTITFKKQKQRQQEWEGDHDNTDLVAKKQRISLIMSFL